MLTRTTCDAPLCTNRSLSAEYQQEISRLADGPLFRHARKSENALQ